MIDVHYTHPALRAEARAEMMIIQAAGIDARLVEDDEARYPRPVEVDDVVYLVGMCECGHCMECATIRGWDRAQAELTEEILGELDEMLRGRGQ